MSEQMNQNISANTKLNKNLNPSSIELSNDEILDANSNNENAKESLQVLVTGPDNKVYRRLGKIRDAHGIRGELYLISFSKNFDWIHESNEFSLVRREKINAHDPHSKTREIIEKFEVQKVKRHKVGVILKLKEINDRTTAEKFKGAVLQMEESIFQEVKADGSYYLAKLLNFKVYNEAQENCGNIVGFSSNGVQDLLEVNLDGKEYSIPYVDALIIKKNFKESWISMRIPEGLIDIESMDSEMDASEEDSSELN